MENFDYFVCRGEKSECKTKWCDLFHNIDMFAIFPLYYCRKCDIKFAKIKFRTEVSINRSSNFLGSTSAPPPYTIESLAVFVKAGKCSESKRPLKTRLQLLISSQSSVQTNKQTTRRLNVNTNKKHASRQQVHL